MKIKQKIAKKLQKKALKKFPRIQWRNDSITLNKKFFCEILDQKKPSILITTLFKNLLHLYKGELSGYVKLNL